MKLRRLHCQSEAFMTLTAVIAFISGAGLDAPSVVPAMLLLGVATFWQPPVRLRRWLDYLWKAAALLLTVRAAMHVLRSPDDIVLPMVDLLLLLLVAEVYRVKDTGNDARVYALTFALLVAAAAYQPGALFALAFILYMATATVSLMAGHLLYSTERRLFGDVTLSGRYLLQTAAFSGIALLTAAVVFLAFPRVTRGMGARGLPVAGNVIGFGDRVSLLDFGGELHANPQVVLRVAFPDGRPGNMGSLHWRGRSFDAFDGASWHHTGALWEPTRSNVDPRVVTPRIVTQQIIAAELPRTKVLFGLHRMIGVRSTEYGFIAYQTPSGDHGYAGVTEPTYTVLSNVARPSEAQLAADSGQAAEYLEPYLQLPDMSRRMHALADSLARGRVTTADKVRAVQDYLRPFSYTIELPQTARDATLEYFLFERRRGHCEYFSTAMAILLRMMDVPARNVNGFLGGEWNGVGSFLNVTQNQAHSWVDVWYPGFGWVEYDPTPASLTGAAARQTSWFAPLRMMLDGANYRWSRWILNYDMRLQLQMFDRVADAFRPSLNADGTPGERDWPAIFRWSLYAAAFVLAFGIMRRAPSLRSRTPGARESSAYQRLRRAYECRGYPASSALPPLAFAGALRSANAPGAVHAAEAVALYVRARFGGEELSEEERAALGDAVRQAKAALRVRPS